MSKLQYVGRPFVVFDPKDKQHRTHYAEFLKTKTWGRCPVRFILAEDQDNVISMIQHSLTQYYTSKEFGKISFGKISA